VSFDKFLEGDCPGQKQPRRKGQGVLIIDGGAGEEVSQKKTKRVMQKMHKKRGKGLGFSGTGLVGQQGWGEKIREAGLS